MNGKLFYVTSVLAEVETIQTGRHGFTFPEISVGPLRAQFVRMAEVVEGYPPSIQALVILDLKADGNVGAEKPAIERHGSRKKAERRNRDDRQ